MRCRNHSISAKNNLASSLTLINTYSFCPCFKIFIFPFFQRKLLRQKLLLSYSRLSEYGTLFYHFESSVVALKQNTAIRGCPKERKHAMTKRRWIQIPLLRFHF